MPGKRAKAADGEKAPPREKVPRVARLLALAHKFQGMLDRGEVASMAELARIGRVSRRADHAGYGPAAAGTGASGGGVVRRRRLGPATSPGSDTCGTMGRSTGHLAPYEVAR